MNILRNTLCLLMVSVIFMTSFCSCSKADYTNAIPAHCTALMSIDVSKASGLKSKTLLQVALLASNKKNLGVDITQKMYVFESVDGNFGLCACVDDVDDLLGTFESLAAKGVCKPVREDNGCYFTVWKNAWVVGFSEQALLLMGPSGASDQSAIQSRMIRYLSQEEGQGMAGTPTFTRLEELNSPMALVAQVQAFPERFAAPLLLGAPKNVDATKVFVAAEVRKRDDCLLLEGETFSFNSRIDEDLKVASKAFRPIQGRYATAMSADAQFGMFLNVDGNYFLPLLHNNASMQAFLTGVNTAIDMDNIFKSVDGDLSIVVSGRENGNVGFSMAAELGHADWLSDVDYWKQSCPAGGRIDSWKTYSYCYSDGQSSYYFGVTADKQFFSGTSSENALASIRPAERPIRQSVQELIRDRKLVFVVNINGLTGSADMFSVLFPILSPFMGNVKTIVYRRK